MAAPVSWVAFFSQVASPTGAGAAPILLFPATWASSGWEIMLLFFTLMQLRRADQARLHRPPLPSPNFLFGLRQWYSRELSTSVPHGAPLVLQLSNLTFSTSIISRISTWATLVPLEKTGQGPTLTENQFPGSISWLNKTHGPSTFNEPYSIWNQEKDGWCCLLQVSYILHLSCHQLRPALIIPLCVS